MVRTRLDLQSRDLSDAISGTTAQKQRRICLEVCKLVVDRTALTDATIAGALALLVEGQYDEPGAVQALGRLGEDLDTKYFEAQELHQSGKQGPEIYRLLFSQARAANAVQFGFDKDPFKAAAGAAYEAGSAIGFADVEAVVRSVLAESS